LFTDHSGTDAASGRRKGAPTIHTDLTITRTLDFLLCLQVVLTLEGLNRVKMRIDPISVRRATFRFF